MDHTCDALSMCYYPLVVVDIFGVGHATAREDDRGGGVDEVEAMFVVDTVSSTFSGVLPVSKF